MRGLVRGLLEVSRLHRSLQIIGVVLTERRKRFARPGQL